MTQKPACIRLILGDQLNIHHPWFETVDTSVLYVMMELRSETDYVKHHIQKLTAFFRAMRTFAKTLRAENHRVEYITLDDTRNTHCITENIVTLAQHYSITHIEYQLPDEYRVEKELEKLSSLYQLSVNSVDSRHFLSTRTDVADFFGTKTYRMENFYRMMRKRYNILMNGKEPVGGSWNFDTKNRVAYKEKHPVPSPLTFSHDVADILSLLEKENVSFFGKCTDKICTWPVTRDDAMKALDWFIHSCLPLFGTYQDAMAREHWALFHSRLSFALNVKLISPREVIDTVIDAYENNPHDYPLHSIEGFVRQILGWREFVRGVYHANMPEYASLNYFNNTRALPHYYWDGETHMACMKNAISNSLHYAYAHHIQRLMITGNFALLNDVHPDAVDNWYLGVYIDAIQWVELPNTRGMSQYADGGIMATKPYISSARYIHSMSDYCTECHYSHTKKTEKDACPFNSLYWAFLHRHRTQLENNFRMKMMYRVLDKMSTQDTNALLKKAHTYMENYETL